MVSIKLTVVVLIEALSRFFKLVLRRVGVCRPRFICLCVLLFPSFVPLFGFRLSVTQHHTISHSSTHTVSVCVLCVYLACPLCPSPLVGLGD